MKSMPAIENGSMAGWRGISMASQKHQPVENIEKWRHAVIAATHTP